MTPDEIDILVFVVGMVVGAVVVAVLSPKRGTVGGPTPSCPPSGSAPYPPPSGTGARRSVTFDAVPPPPPKVYPEGKPPRRARPSMGCPCDAGEPEWCRTRGDSPTAKPWPIIRVCDCDCGHPERCETHPGGR